MADSTLSRFKDEVAKSPAADRLKEELQNYLQARAHQAVAGLGARLGEGVSKLADPGQAPGGLAKSLAKGGEALGQGKSPAQAAMAAGTSHAKEMMKDKIKGLFGKAGKPKSGGGKSKSVTIVEDIDVGVPVREAYDQWTQFQEFSTFAKGVVSVEKSDDVSSNWKVKVAKSTRSWKANVTEQIPDQRISWTTEGAKGTVKGVVTFHRLTDDLTRVLLVLEYFPGGFFEKTGNIWRAQGRRARLDLKLYRKFIMMRGEATDGWRGEIRDGEVTVGHDEAAEEEGRAEEAGYDGPPGDEYGEYEESEEEPEDEAGDAYADGDLDEESDENPDQELDQELDEESDGEVEEDEEAYADGEFADEDDPGHDEPEDGADDLPEAEAEDEDEADAEAEHQAEDEPEDEPEDEDEAPEELADEYGEGYPEDEADEYEEGTGRAAARR